MKTIFKATLLFFFVTSLSLFAQKDYTSEPGYFDFEKFGKHQDKDLKTEVLLEDKLLKMAAKVTDGREADLSDIINGLKLISVRVYDVAASDNAGYQAKIKDMDASLKSNNWDRIVMTRDNGDYANVYIKTKGELVVGLVVVALDGADTNSEGEIVYVNIVGDIDLAKIGKLSSRFDIPNLDKVNQRDGGRNEK